MSADDFKLITDRVGLVGGIALLMGTAVGMSIFLVPTQMAAEAGPSITLAILVSVLPMVLGVLLLLQLGGAIPVAGGNYVYGSRLIGPFWGLIGVTVPILAVWSYLLFAALGFAEFLPVFLEAVGVTADVPYLAAAWAILGLFLVLNYQGIQLVTRVQIGLVGLIILGMLTFVVIGAFHVDPGNYTPLFPDGEGQPFAEGIGPFFTAMVALYIPFQGFAMIIEIGEELESPVKNIPRVLAIGMTLVALLTIAVIVVLVGAVPWEQIAADGETAQGGIAAAAAGVLPTWAVALVALTALVAAATTINTLLTSYSRTIMRAARDQVVPEYFAAIHEENGTPHRAILTLAVPPILLAPFAYPFERWHADALGEVAVLDWLVVVVVSGIFIAFMLGGVALWNLPKVFPKRYEYSFYTLPMPVLKLVAVGNVLVSGLFLVAVGLSEAPTALPVVFGWIALSGLVYVYRIRKYEKKGVDLRAKMALLHKHEQLGGGEEGAD